MSSSVRLGAYLLVALLGAFELYTLWLVLHPDVPDDYRAYYISKTTTCLNQPVSGSYSGGVISFRSEGGDATKPLKVCGWEGPAGDGTHAVGTSARLRFVVDEAVPDPVLAVEMIAVKKDQADTQRVDIVINGERLEEIVVSADAPQSFTVPLSARAAAPGTYEVIFEFPDAIRMGETDPETRWRSIKLTAAGIVSADS